MIASVTDYFRRLGEGFGQGWTRFWFTPGDAATVSAIRMGVGLIVVYLHATLSFDLVALFGPNGLLPVADIEPLEGGSFSYLNYLVAPANCGRCICWAWPCWSRLPRACGPVSRRCWR